MPRMVSTLPLPPMSLGTERFIRVHSYGDPEDSPKIYLQAGLHANEIPGLLVLHHLIRLLDEADNDGAIKGHIVIVPVANPIGQSQHFKGSLHGRFHLDAGENFNRHYPDLGNRVGDLVEANLSTDGDRNTAAIRKAIGSILEEEVVAAETELQHMRLALMQMSFDADIALDLHCDDIALMHLYLAEHCWPDGQDLHAQIGSDATMLANISGDNPFDEALSKIWWDLKQRFDGKFPISSACLSGTVELRGSADVGDALAEEDAANLFRFMQRRGIVAGDPGPLPAEKCEAAPLSAVDMIKSPYPGVLTYKKPLGALVEAGETIADLVEPTAENPAEARFPITAQTSGRLFSMRSQKFVWPGQYVAKIAGKEPLEGREGKLLTS